VNDYDRIAGVIRFLDEHHAEQPSLAELAAAIGLSESHFHRLFRRWAGVTPKDFLQCLTVEHAKQQLRASASVLEAALATGLSGPGRLHDLLVHLEAASPGEFKQGGRGLQLEWGWAASPFGRCTLAWTERGLCHLAFHDDDAPSGALPSALSEAWPQARLHRHDTAANRRASRIFAGHRASAPPRVFVAGTPFQLQVWRALVRIPAGDVTSYGALAGALGRPHAARAVGTACGANPLAFLIPCHRVIRETGVVQGYRWGNTRKRALLAWEAAPRLHANGRLSPARVVRS